MPSFGSGISGKKIIETLPSNYNIAPDSSGNYTVPGTLVQTFTTSGTYTPGSGVTKVNVVVIGGGGNGNNGGNFNFINCGGTRGGGGGAGGAVRVYLNVPVSSPVSVTIGGAGTQSSFGSLTAAGGQSASGVLPGISSNPLKSKGGAGGIVTISETQGQSGPLINGTAYAGGGGGGNWSTSFGYSQPGGAGGGGAGRGNGNGGYGIPAVSAAPGTAGTGGGGGGGSNTTAGSGATGRVMIFVE